MTLLTQVKTLLMEFIKSQYCDVVLVSLPPTGGPRAAHMLRERYVWSVFPSLAAWPALMMETGPGAVVVSLLLVRHHKHITMLPLRHSFTLHPHSLTVLSGHTPNPHDPLHPCDL